MTSIIQKKPLRPDPKSPVRPPVTPPVKPPVRPHVIPRPPVPPRPGPIRSNDIGFVPPSERKPAALAEPVISMDKGRLPPGMQKTPAVQKPSGSTNFMPELKIPVGADRTDLGPKQPPTSGGTPISIKDAPGYRGIGTPTMPSSLPLGAKKGGVVTTRRISTAAKSKKQSSW